MDASHTETYLDINIEWLHSSVSYNTGSNNHYLTLPVDIEKRYTANNSFLELQPTDIQKAFRVEVLDSSGALFTGFVRVDLYFSYVDL